MSAFGTSYLGGTTRRSSTGWTNPYQNPYSSKVSLYDGTSVNVAPTIGALYAGAAWQDQQNAAGSGASGGAGGSGGVQGPFTTLRNPKNPAVESTTSSILDAIRGLTTDSTLNQNTVKASVKSPAMAKRIATAGKNYDLDTNNSQQSLKDFVSAYMSTQPAAQANADQESAALGRVYDSGANGLEAQLKRLAAQRAISTTQEAQRAMQQAATANNGARMTQPSSSYLDAMLMSSVGGIATQAAKEKADQDRANLLTVLEAQSNLAGKRNAITDAVLNRRLAPIQASQQVNAGSLANLASLLGLDAANTYYEVDSPEKLLARRLGLLGDASRVDLANTFYGLSKPYEASAPPVLPSYDGGADADVMDLIRQLIGQSGGGATAPAQSPTLRVPTQAERDAALAEYAKSPQGQADFRAAYPSQFTAPAWTPPAGFDDQLRYSVEDAAGVDIAPNFLSQFANYS